MAFSQEEILSKIIEVVNPDEPITMDTVILDHEDMDSLAIFNIFITFRQEGLKVNFDQVGKCNTVKDLVELIAGSL